jgi:hypothetical protein
MLYSQKAILQSSWVILADGRSRVKRHTRQNRSDTKNVGSAAKKFVAIDHSDRSVAPSRRLGRDITQPAHAAQAHARSAGGPPPEMAPREAPSRTIVPRRMSPFVNCSVPRGGGSVPIGLVNSLRCPGLAVEEPPRQFQRDASPCFALARLCVEVEEAGPLATSSGELLSKERPRWGLVSAAVGVVMGCSGQDRLGCFTRCGWRACRRCRPGSPTQSGPAGPCHLSGGCGPAHSIA